LEALFSMVRAAAVSTQRRVKHVSTAMNQHSTIEELLETVCSARSVLRGYQREKFRLVERFCLAYFGTTQCLWYNWVTLFLGVINTGTWPSRWGKSRIWHSKISWVPWDSDLRMTTLARPSSNCKRQTHPFVRGFYIRSMTKCSVENYWSWVSRGLSPRRTDWR
jgi:hypothetical protein